jgi:hypothetical protein
VAVVRWYRGTNEFEKGHQPGSNLVKMRGALYLRILIIILNRWRNYICRLLNVHGASGVRQTEKHTAESFVPIAPEIEVAVGKMKMYKSPGVDQIPDKLF